MAKTLSVAKSGHASDRRDYCHYSGKDIRLGAGIGEDIVI